MTKAVYKIPHCLNPKCNASFLLVEFLSHRLRGYCSKVCEKKDAERIAELRAIYGKTFFGGEA